MPVATETRPEITVTAFHRFVRWLYRLIFGTILLGIITGIIQGFVMSGNFQVPSHDDLQHIWYVRGFIQQPWLYAPITLLLAALGIGGFLIDRRLDAADARAQRRETAAIASAAAKQHVDAALPTFQEALSTQLETHGQQVQATITNLLGQLPKTAAPTSYGGPFDDGSLHRPTPFVGRGDELAWLMTRLQSSTPTVMAVGGMGGIGKTGLVAEAIARAHQHNLFPDGIAVILCRERDDALGILRDVITRFDPQRQPPQAQDLAGLTDSARSILHGKRVAVVLDNIEPEVTIRDIVQPLRDVGATVIITARHELPLDVCTMDNQLRLDILAPSEALDLFEQVYLREGRTMNDVLRAAAQRIVATLGYHTYGIRLISAYAGDVRPDLDRLASELERDPTFALGIRNVDASEFLGAVFARSIDALTSEAQSLALALGLVPANTIGRLATLALAAGIGLSDRDADQSLTLLSRRAIVTINEEQPADESDSVRVQLHPLMYAYLKQRGHEQLPPVQQVAALDALEVFFARYTNTAPHAALAVDEAVIHALIERAHSLNHIDGLVYLCNGMRIYWRDRSRIQAALRYLPWAINVAQQQTEQLDDATVRRRRANLTVFLADIYADIGQLDPTEQLYRADLKERQALHDRQNEGGTLSRLGQIAQRRSQLDEATNYFQQAIVINREVHDRRGEGVVLSQIGQIAQSRGQLDEATDYLQQGLVIAHEVQDRRGEGEVLSHLGQIAQSRGQLDEAIDYFQQALIIDCEVQNRQGEGVDLASLGQIAQSCGQLDEATAYFQQALIIVREVRDRRGEGMVLYFIAILREKKGEMAQAEQAHRDSLAISLELGIAPDSAPSQEELAALLMRHAPEQSQREACQLLTQAQSIYQELGQTDDADRVAQSIREHGC